MNGEKITNSAECEDAANKIGKTFKFTINNVQFPNGCFVNQPGFAYNDTGSDVYYNFNNNLATASAGNLLCRKIEGMPNI